MTFVFIHESERRKRKQFVCVCLNSSTPPPNTTTVSQEYYTDGKQRRWAIMTKTHKTLEYGCNGLTYTFSHTRTHKHGTRNENRFKCYKEYGFVAKMA